MAAALIVPAVLLARRLRPGGLAILLLFALGLLLTATHPNHKGRYVHSWIALGWLSAGLGAAALVYGPLTARLAVVRPWLSAAALSALACLLLPALRVPALAGRWAASGEPVAARCDGLLSSGVGSFARCGDCVGRATQTDGAVDVSGCKGDLRRLENNWYGYGPPGEGNREKFKDWLKEPRKCDTLIFVDRLPGQGVGWEQVPEVVLHAELRDLVLAQQAFRLVKKQDFPQHGCSVFVWTRQELQTTERK